MSLENTAKEGLAKQTNKQKHRSVKQRPGVQNTVWTIEGRRKKKGCQSEAGLAAGRVWPRWLAAVGHAPEGHKLLGQKS